MGKVITPKYRVEYRDQQGQHSMAWNVGNPGGGPYPGDGKPTQPNLEKWRKALNKSFRPGGVNAHVSEALGFVLYVSAARIVNQATGAK